MKLSSLARRKLNSFPEDVQKFFQKIDIKLSQAGFTLILTSGKTVNNSGGRCSGYFDSLNKELKVALGKDLDHVLGVCIHEYSHWVQLLDESSVWHQNNNDENHSNFFSWLGGERFSQKDVKKFCMSAIAIEQDCDRRALKEIKKNWAHYIDTDMYARKSVSYHASYLWVMKHRKWMRKSPYDRKIIAHAPSEIVPPEKFPENLLLALERWL